KSNEKKYIEVDEKTGKMTVVDPSRKTPEGKKRYPVFANVNTVRIDFGAAFGDARRKYNENTATNGKITTVLKYYPSSEGPPAYDLKIPALVRDNPDSF